MRRTVRCAVVVIGLIVVSRPGRAGTSPAPTSGEKGSKLLESTLMVPRFGTVHLYRPTEHPANVVLFLSGDGGWNRGVVDMARAVAREDALVVGIDILHYMKEIKEQQGECAYSAADIEALSQTVQQRLGFPVYHPPALVGYSSGATLAYAVVAQSPANTVRGGVGLGFCPDLELPRPLCKGNGLEYDVTKPAKHPGGISTYVFRPAPHPTSTFIALQGEIDQVCDPPATERYMGKVGGGKVVMLPKVGHGYSVTSRWQPQFLAALQSLLETPAEATAHVSEAPARPTADNVDDLPLVALRPTGTPRHDLVVLLSGDGGWANIDRDVGGALARAGLPVVGWNSLQYYWHKKTPERAAADLERILRHYLSATQSERALLLGYSFGADVLPFLVDRLPADLREKVALVGLLGPSPGATFEFHVSDWLGGGEDIPTRPAVEKLRGMNILCVYGEREKDSLCPQLPTGLAKLLPAAGSHHFGGDYEKLAAAVLEAAGPAR